MNVEQSNWARSYAARGYIKYQFGGKEFTVYDDHYSVRNVQYVLVQQANDTSKYFAHWYAIHICNYMLTQTQFVNSSRWNWQSNAWNGDNGYLSNS